MSGPFTLAQAVFGKSCIYVVCQHCGHFTAISYEQTCALGGNKPVAEIERRYFCRVCERRDAKIQTNKPLVGERLCPKCGSKLWKGLQVESVAANVPRCSRCLTPLRRR